MSKIAGPLAKRTNRDQIAQDCLDTFDRFSFICNSGDKFGFPAPVCGLL